MTLFSTLTASPPHQSLSRRGGRRRVAGMRYFLLMIAVVALVGCGESAEEKAAKAKAAAAEARAKAAAAEAKAAADWKVIEKAIRVELKKPKGELTKADYEKVTELNLVNAPLTEWPKGLEKLTNLTELNLNNNSLRDLKSLEKLTQLEWLELQNNAFLTKAQIDALQQALPNCKISSDFE